ncbi:MAG: hypothetical protein ACK41T_08635 [Pseudobdellovibrio sp.]
MKNLILATFAILLSVVGLHKFSDKIDNDITKHATEAERMIASNGGGGGGHNTKNG